MGYDLLFLLLDSRPHHGSLAFPNDSSSQSLPSVPSRLNQDVFQRLARSSKLLPKNTSLVFVHHLLRSLLPTAFPFCRHLRLLDGLPFSSLVQVRCKIRWSWVPGVYLCRESVR